MDTEDRPGDYRATKVSAPGSGGMPMPITAGDGSVLKDSRTIMREVFVVFRFPIIFRALRVPFFRSGFLTLFARGLFYGLRFFCRDGLVPKNKKPMKL